MRAWLLPVSIVALLPASLLAQGVSHPATVTPDGGGPVRLAAEARRMHLLGAMEVYSLALYVDGARPDRTQLLSRDVPKALRILVTYKEDLYRGYEIDWRRELIPRLPAAATTHLVGAFAPLQHGDVVQIEYAPGKGTTVRVNRSVAVNDASHDLMLSFLDHWLGQRPVSEDLKRALLGSS